MMCGNGIRLSIIPHYAIGDFSWTIHDGAFIMLAPLPDEASQTLDRR